MKITIKKDSEAAKAFESLREDKQEFKESVQSGKTLSPFLEGYEQINQNNPVTRGSTALVMDKEQQKQLITEIMDLDAKDGLYEHIGDVNKMIEISDEEIEKAAENYGWRIKTNTFSDPVKANELAQSAKQDFMEGAKWYKEQLKNIDKKL